MPRPRNVNVPRRPNNSQLRRKASKISVKKEAGRKVKTPSERLQVMVGMLKSKELSKKDSLQLAERIVLLSLRLNKHAQDGAVSKDILVRMIGRSNTKLLNDTIENLEKKKKIKRTGKKYNLVV